ncbi:helix-turn-helix domain-containing protein [Enterobacter sichuanensis]|uniref:helix-turn-helix domain-containing protein n=1 Tax=Enterobacter sichuanensis TaxID=2071710 RepID=UPI00217EB4BC|nr:helix-turn-helix domain-containing protein [Enterobacter sichuanensis]WKW90260.1 hypothetical protein DKJFHMON_00183 [Enterobacter sichuanensis]
MKISSEYVLNYPKKEIEELLTALSPHGFHTRLNKRQRIITKNNHGGNIFYIITRGYVSYRYNENGIVVTYAFPNSLIGVFNFFNEQHIGFFYAETEVDVICIDMDKFNEVFSTNSHLWRNLSVYMSYMCQKLLARDLKINSKNAYKTVKSLIIEFNELPEKIRQTVSVSFYILERTHLARSTVMHLLSQLQKGGYITIEKGMLINLSKLPQDF